MAKPEYPSTEGHLEPVTWDSVKDAELDDSLRATPAQRLIWLEEVIRLAWTAGASKMDTD